MHFLVEYPLLLVAAAAVFVVVLANWARPGMPRKDPKRAFDSRQSSVGMLRADHRCEMGLLFRCKRGAHHGDHFFPHSRGGATNLENFVAACPRHNLAKGARMPSRALQTAIELRRGRYFNPGVDVSAGAWFGGAR